MPLQDLTPQLRTRLGRLERVVGLFVSVAVLLMIAGLALYLHRQAKSRGWFLLKLPYFTFVRNAGGLKEGDPVKLMGFDVGTITKIEAQPAEDAYYDVFVAFEIKSPYYGYLWEHSRAKIVSGDLLGNRFIEVTKGTNGTPTYVFSPLVETTVAGAASLNLADHVFGQEVYDSSGTNLLANVNEPVTPELLQKLEGSGVSDVLLVNRGQKLRRPEGVWDFRAARYETLTKMQKADREKGYFLPPIESTAVAERAEALLSTVEAAIPNVLDLTNQLRRLMTRAADAADRADRLLLDAQPILRNLDSITGNLTNSQGALGDWLFTSDFTVQLTQTLANANGVLTNADARLDALTANLTDALKGLDETLENLAQITGNLNSQVAANTNLVSSVSRLIVDADHFVQGLKRHWLLRPAFREQDGAARPAGAEKEIRRARSPRDSER